MIEYPLLDEIHKKREEIAKKFNFDIDAIIDYFVELENRHQSGLGNKLEPNSDVTKQ